MEAYRNTLGLRRRTKIAESSASSSCRDEQFLVDPDVFIFARSDTLLMSPIRIPDGGLLSDEIWIPGWQTMAYEYVDRFAVAGANAAEVYARAKVDGFTSFIRNYNGTITRENYNGTSAHFMEKEALHCSEKMMKRWLDENELMVKRQKGWGGKERWGKERWAQLIRVRSGGRLNERDAATFNITNVEVAKMMLSAQRSVQRNRPSR
jgi:hypothetical protein